MKTILKEHIRDSFILYCKKLNIQGTVYCIQKETVYWIILYESTTTICGWLR